MFNFKKELIFQTIIFVALFSIESCSAKQVETFDYTIENFNSSLERGNVFDSLGQIFSVATSFYTGDIIGGISGSLSFIGGLFGPDPFDEINRKLDEIINKLNSISLELKSLAVLIPCTSYFQDYRNNIRVKLQNIVDALIFYFKSNDQNYRDNVKEICRNPYTGINYIYSAIKDLENDYISQMRICGKYTSDSISGWARTMDRIGAMFLFAVKGCEKAFGHQVFDSDKFANDMKGLINYYTYRGFPEAFVNDPGDDGLKQTLTRILNENTGPDQIVPRLKRNYDYFNWHVIRYSAGIEGWNKHTSWTLGDNLCRGEHFIRVLQHSNNAYVSWCIADDLNNNIINFQNDGTHCSNSVDKTVKANPGLRFSYVIAVDHNKKWVEVGGNRNLMCRDFGKMKMCASLNKDLIIYKPVLSGSAILFP